MEQIINAKKGANDVKLKFEQSASVTPAIWNDYAAIQHEIDGAITPLERNEALEQAIRFRMGLIDVEKRLMTLVTETMNDQKENEEKMTRMTAGRVRVVDNAPLPLSEKSVSPRRRASGLEFKGTALSSKTLIDDLADVSESNNEVDDVSTTVTLTKSDLKHEGEQTAVIVSWDVIRGEDLV